MNIVLASSSVYRKELLQRLQIDFFSAAPSIDEKRHENEPIGDFVKRLSIEKATVLADRFPQSLIIGSDQVIVTTGGTILGKPHTHEAATRQLKLVSGTEVELMTGLALFNNQTQQLLYEAVSYHVGFRPLSDTQIDNYLRIEKPYNCAGSLKAEGLGICLLRYLRGEDPTAIIGLPLISLTEMLLKNGVKIPASD